MPTSSNDLDDLKSRIQQARAQGVGEPVPSVSSEKPGDLGDSRKGLRAIADLIGTPVICGAIGIGLDRWFDTAPFGFIFLAFLGLLAGFWGLYKMEAGIGSEVGFRRLQSGKKDGKKAQLSRDTAKE